jgi:peptidoglycan/LPS O-acetylase OafA/YrhL
MPAASIVSSRRPELDGLRGLAIGFVLLSHVLLANRNPLGLVGVSVFFTLSGYLITGLLLRDGVHLRAFYGRRFRRLAPAFLVMVAVVAVLGLFGVWGYQPWITTAFGLATYTANWITILGYMAVPFGHVWTLAIEEQFYLVWPVLMAILPRKSWGPLLVIAVVVGFLSRAQGGYFGYFATTSYLDVIGLGCAAAIWGKRLPVRWLGVPVILVAVPLASPPLAAIGAVLMCVSSSQVLSPLGALGRRGYSLYLWDWPTFLLFGPLGILPALVLGEVSYRFIERRFIAEGPATTSGAHDEADALDDATDLGIGHAGPDRQADRPRVRGFGVREVAGAVAHPPVERVEVERDEVDADADAGGSKAIDGAGAA